MTFFQSPPGEGWTILERIQQGATELQWDGGTNYSIHGHSIRHLYLDVAALALFMSSEAHAFRFELLAEGYRRCVAVPVRIKVDSEPNFRRPDDQHTPDWL